MFFITDALAAAAAKTAAGVGESIVFDWTINIGNVLTLLTLICGGAWWLISFHYDLRSLRNEVATLRDVLNGLKDVLATLGRHEERFSSSEHRIERLENELDELRRGEGFIMPLGRFRPPEPGK